MGAGYKMRMQHPHDFSHHTPTQMTKSIITGIADEICEKHSVNRKSLLAAKMITPIQMQVFQEIVCTVVKRHPSTTWRMLGTSLGRSHSTVIRYWKLGTAKKVIQ